MRRELLIYGAERSVIPDSCETLQKDFQKLPIVYSGFLVDDAAGDYGLADFDFGVLGGRNFD